jgi:hypothetical protein
MRRAKQHIKAIKRMIANYVAPPKRDSGEREFVVTYTLRDGTEVVKNMLAENKSKCTWKAQFHYALKDVGVTDKRDIKKIDIKDNGPHYLN